MDIRQFYQTTGGDFDQALSRLGKEERIQKFARMFSGDDSMANLRAAVEAGDIQASFRAAHTLKGVAGNLSFSSMYDAASALTEQLRPLEAPADPALYAAVEEKYDQIIAALGELD